MGEVKSAYEMAMEKISKIEALTSEEKAEMRDREEIRSLLAAFYKGQIDRDEMWKKFKTIKPALIKEAQHNMADSLRPNNTPDEFRQRKDGILALETLKQKQNSSAVEGSINVIERLQRENLQTRERATKELRAAVEQNPQLRMRPVRTPDGRTAYQATLSVDEAVQAKMSEFLAEHEKRYELMFNQAVAKLKSELR